MVEITLTDGRTITVSNEVYEETFELAYFCVDDEIISSCAIVEAKLL